MATSPLFTADELSDFAQYEVDEPHAVIAERVVRGWLLAATGRAEWNPVPADLFAWALELGLIAHENPNGATTSRSSGAETESWALARRAELLELAAAAYPPPGGPGFTRSGPQGSFPRAGGWPDPAGGRGPQVVGVWGSTSWA